MLFADDIIDVTVMKRTHNRSGTSGFALPTVMIASVVMLMVLLSGLVATSAVNSALREQYAQKQVSSAADAGLVMANACLQANNYEITWSESQPLRPNTDCFGDEIVSCPNTSTDSRCYFTDAGSIRTKFRVDTTINKETVNVEGSILNVRTTTGSIANVKTLTIRGARVTTKAPSVSASGSYTCAIAADTKVYCWGYNGYGTLGNGTTSTTANVTPTMIQQGAIPTNVLIENLAATYTHACVIASDGKAYCWGTNTNGELGNNSTVSAYAPVAVSQGAMPVGLSLRTISGGYYHTCAIGNDRKVYCWGNNGEGQLGNGGVGASSNVPVVVLQGAMPQGVYAVSLSSAYNSTCALASNKKVYCWGRNLEGQLGNNTTTNATSPVEVNLTAMGTAGATAIAAGYYHSCALGTDGSSYCWGQNSAYQLGNGTTTQSLVATKTPQGAVPSNVRLTQLSTYYQHTCAIGSNSLLYCWGMNAYRQIGNASTTTATTPTLASTISNAPGGSITGISTGDYHTCINSSNAKIYCWGYNAYGGLGNVNAPNPSDVAQVTGSNTALGYGRGLSVVAGGGATCAISIDSKPYCWGYNSVGQLGNGNTINSASPADVSNGAIPVGVDSVSLSGGGGTVCMLGSDAKIYCWGGNDTGQLGNGNTTNSSLPVAVQQGAVPAGVSVRGLSVGGGLGTNACMLGSDGNAYCWGGNSRGQLGNGSTINSSTPVLVSRGSMPVGVTIRSISTSGETTCALGTDDKAYCWGRNDWGQIGNGTTVASSTPVAVSQGAIPAGVTLRSISVGQATCAVGSDSKAYCWGYNMNGLLGNGTTTASNVPVAVSQGSMPIGVKVKELSVTSPTACVIGTDLKAYCWGDNSTGQVGDGTGTNATTPKAVVAGAIPAGVTIRSIRTGGGHTCAIGSNSRVYCWGDNQWGQLGYGTFDAGSLTPLLPTQSLRWSPTVTVDSMIIRY